MTGMIRNIRISALLCILAMAASCVSENLDNISSSGRVRLYASIPMAEVSITPAVKGSPEDDSGIRDYGYEGSMDIALARVDDGYVQYPDFINSTGPLTATLGAPDKSTSTYLREINFDNAQFFPGTGSRISYAAFYPWPKDEASRSGYNFFTDGTSTKVTIPIDGATDIMYSSPVEGTITEDFDVVEFHHSLCQYRIHVYAMVYDDSQDASGNDEDIADVWGALTDMSVLDMESSCSITLPLTRQDGSYSSEVAFGGEKRTIPLSKTDDIFFDPGTELPVGKNNKRHVATFIAAPPEDGVLDLVLKTVNSAAEQDISIARSFLPGYAYDIVLRFSDHGIINADVSVSEWQDGGEVDKEYNGDVYYNLSTYGTSNCYHISSANYSYCFNATVKGNGQEFAAGESGVLLDPAYVDIVWADIPDIEYNNETICPLVLSSHHLLDGNIMLRVLGDDTDSSNKELKSEGNVLIAAYDREPEKDADGNITNGAEIIWTWHLWLCDPVQDQGYSNGFIVQDRNLGALSAEPGDRWNDMWGMLYQWGRPTPFRNGTGGEYMPDASSSEKVTMAEAIAHPDMLYGTAEQGDDVWIDDPELRPYLENLWGYVSDWTDPRKTIYDPCPQGYRVFEERMWRNLEQYNPVISSEYVTLSNPPYTIYFPFQDTFLADGTLVEHGSGSDSDYGAFLWSGTIDVGQDPHTPYRLIYGHDGSAVSTADDHRRNSAMPVRCVSEHSEMIIKNLSEAQTANCYIVDKTGYYKFKADIRGNGVGRLFPYLGSKEADLTDGLDIGISPDRVDFLWWQGDFVEENDPASCLDISFLNGGKLDSDGYVTFLVNEFHKGNLILAAYDADDRILWSWHIWMTDTPQIKASGIYAVMDRFLGATAAPSVFSNPLFYSEKEARATCGFYYQWGRKDPIPGAPEYNSDDLNSLASSKWWKYDVGNQTWLAVESIETAPAESIAASVSDPMKFYTSSTAAGGDNSVWFASDFVDEYKNVALWGYAVNGTGIGESFTKTMYDPCPPGYMVAEYKVWLNATSSNLNSPPDNRYSDADSGSKNLSHGEAGYNRNGFYGMVTTLQDFDVNWFPMAGRRMPTTGYVEDAGWFGHFWTGLPMGKVNARSLYYTTREAKISGQVADNGTTGVMITPERGSVSVSGATGPAYGFPVRCMKE